MGIKITITADYGDTVTDAYGIIGKLHYSNVRKIGYLTLCFWKDQTARNTGLKPINETLIPIEKQELLDKDGAVENLNATEFGGKDLSVCYTTLKLKKVKINSNIVDLSKSVDVLEESK